MLKKQKTASVFLSGYLLLPLQISFTLAQDQTFGRLVCLKPKTQDFTVPFLQKERHARLVVPLNFKIDFLFDFNWIFLLQLRVLLSYLLPF